MLPHVSAQWKYLIWVWNVACWGGDKVLLSPGAEKPLQCHCAPLESGQLFSWSLYDQFDLQHYLVIFHYLHARKCFIKPLWKEQDVFFCPVWSAVLLSLWAGICTCEKLIYIWLKWGSRRPWGNTIFQMPIPDQLRFGNYSVVGKICTLHGLKVLFCLSLYIPG